MLQSSRDIFLIIIHRTNYRLDHLVIIVYGVTSQHGGRVVEHFGRSMISAHRHITVNQQHNLHVLSIETDVVLCWVVE